MFRVEYLTEGWRIICVRCGEEARTKPDRREHRCSRWAELSGGMR